MTPAAPPASLAHTAGLIRNGKARKIAVLTGAGISTSAGIPDFRSPGTGLYDNLAALNLPFPEAVFSLDYFESRPEPFWALAKDLYPGKYLPTPTHYFLSLLHQKGLLQRVWTQNIDTLETAAGVPDDLVLEAHGSFRTAHCLGCRKPASTEHVLASGVREGKVVRCARENCDGLVKPDIVFFGEGLPDDFFVLQRELRKADLVLIIGTSLQVMPFAGLVHAVGGDVPRLLINREAVGPFEDLAHGERDGRDALWLGDADEAIRALVKEIGWDDEFDELLLEGKSKLRQNWEEREKLGTPAKGKSQPGKSSSEEDKSSAKEPDVKASTTDKDTVEDKDTVKPQSKAAVEDETDVDVLAEGVQRIGLDPKAKV